MKKILIIDDEQAYCKKLQLCFTDYKLIPVSNWQSAERVLSFKEIDLVLLDLNLDNSDELDGLKLIEPLKQMKSNIPLIVVTNDEKTQTVVHAMKLGADDFLRKSEFDSIAWKNKFSLLISNFELKNKVRDIEESKYPFIGISAEIENIKRTLDVLAQNPDVSVLITGETGVGKEVAARYIHKKSKRVNKPFVAVHISSISNSLLESELFGHKKGAYTDAKEDRDGFFKKADGGILFLDEIGEISAEIQVKLLRFLDTKTIQSVGSDKQEKLDVQIISATNQNLKKLIQNGTFRSDLYFRFRNFEVEIPALRYRRCDIESLLEFYFFRKSIKLSSLPDNIIRLLENYDWPGNIRELINVVEYSKLKQEILRKPHIDIECLPNDIKSNIINSVINNNKKNDNNMEKEIIHTELKTIESALDKTAGQKSKAAELLNLNADQLRYMVLKNWKKAPNEFSEYKLILKYYKLRG